MIFKNYAFTLSLIIQFDCDGWQISSIVNLVDSYPMILLMTKHIDNCTKLCEISLCMCLKFVDIVNISQKENHTRTTCMNA